MAEDNTYGEFEELLGLRKPAVAVKLSLEPPQNLSRLEKKLRVCEMLEEASLEGKAFYAEPEDHASFVDRYWLGIRAKEAVPERVQHAGHRRAFASKEAFRNLVRQAVKIETGAVRIVSCAPLRYLADHPSFEPDLVVCYCNPGQAHKVIHGDHYTADSIGSKLYYGAGSSSSIAAPYVERKIGISFSDSATRSYTKLSPEELLVTIPWERFSTLVTNLRQWLQE